MYDNLRSDFTVWLHFAQAGHNYTLKYHQGTTEFNMNVWFTHFPLSSTQILTYLSCCTRLSTRVQFAFWESLGTRLWFTHFPLSSTQIPTYPHALVVVLPINSVWVRLCLVVLTCGHSFHTHDRSVGWTACSSCRIQRLGPGRMFHAVNLPSWKGFALHHYKFLLATPHFARSKKKILSSYTVSHTLNFYHFQYCK